MKKLLVVVDMQNDFVYGTLGSLQARQIVSKIADRIIIAKSLGEDVVFTRDSHDENYLKTKEGRKLPVEHCIKSSYGWQIIDGLSVEGAKIIDKSNFSSMELANFVYAKGYSAIEFVGVCTDICIVSNAILISAVAPMTDVFVSESLCAGTSVENHKNAISVLSACQIEII